MPSKHVLRKLGCIKHVEELFEFRTGATLFKALQGDSVVDSTVLAVLSSVCHGLPWVIC